MTYNELINMSIKEVNNVGYLTISELILYHYHHKDSSKIDKFDNLKLIYKAFVDMGEFSSSLFEAIDELVDTHPLEEDKKELRGIATSMMQALMNFENPLTYWEDEESAWETFFKVCKFYFLCLETLESWGYDIKKLHQAS